MDLTIPIWSTPSLRPKLNFFKCFKNTNILNKQIKIAGLSISKYIPYVMFVTQSNVEAINCLFYSSTDSYCFLNGFELSLNSNTKLKLNFLCML